MTARSRWAIHGLVVESPVPLAALEDRSGGPVDVVVDVEVLTVPPDPPEGRVLAEVHDDAAGRAYALVERGDTWVLHLHGSARCEITTDGPVTHVHVGSAVTEDLLAVLLSGPVVTAAALRAGRRLLHASAVGHGAAHAIAFVAPSGGGKTSVATMLATASMPLLSDDTLAVEGAVGGATVWPGTTRSRLRSGSPLHKDAATATADGRYAAAVPTVHTAAPRPLDAVFRVLLSTQVEDPRVVVLDEHEALTALLGSTPLEGTRGTLLVAHFEACADLVAGTPVGELWIPWTTSPEALARTAEQVRAVIADHGFHAG